MENAEAAFLFWQDFGVARAEFYVADSEFPPSALITMAREFGIPGRPATRSLSGMSSVGLEGLSDRARRPFRYQTWRVLHSSCSCRRRGSVGYRLTSPVSCALRLRRCGHSARRCAFVCANYITGALSVAKTGASAVVLDRR
jgi:hypothetical protein